MASLSVTMERTSKVAAFSERIPQLKKKRHLSHGLKLPIKFIKDDIMSAVSGGFGGDRNNVLLKPFTDAIVRLFEAGIATHILKNAWKGLFDDFVTSVSDAKDHENEVLTIEHLEAGLLLWLGCVGVAVIVFLAELIVFRIRIRNLDCDGTEISCR